MRNSPSCSTVSPHQGDFLSGDGVENKHKQGMPRLQGGQLQVESSLQCKISLLTPPALSYSLVSSEISRVAPPAQAVRNCPRNGSLCHGGDATDADVTVAVVPGNTQAIKVVEMCNGKDTVQSKTDALPPSISRDISQKLALFTPNPRGSRVHIR